MPPGQDIISQREFEQLLDRVQRALRGIEGQSQRLLRNSYRLLPWLPPRVSTQLGLSLDALGHLLAQFFAEVLKLVANPGWPPGLMSTGGRWSSHVGKPVIGLAGMIHLDAMAVDEKWDSPASRAYAESFERQKIAVEGVKELTDVLDTNLTKVGWAIVALWATLGVSVVGFLVEISAEAASTVTPAAPAAAPAAAASTAKVIGLVTAAVGLFITYGSLVVDALIAMRQKAGAPQFPGGEWPESTTSNFDDASMADGDPSDWRMRKTEE